VPFYDYVCQACGRRIEVMHGVHATGPERCDACGGHLRRAISRPSIHFKGSGWAKMDARAQAVRTGDTTAPAEGSDDGPPGHGDESAGERRADEKEPASGPSERSAAGPSANDAADGPARPTTRKGSKATKATKGGATPAPRGQD
jgi:putative FmdB family regulatory protein